MKRMRFKLIARLTSVTPVIHDTNVLERNFRKSSLFNNKHE